MDVQPHVDSRALDFHSVPNVLLGVPVYEAFDRGERYVKFDERGVVFHEISDGYVCEGCGEKAMRAVQQRKGIEGILTGNPRYWTFSVEMPYCPNCEDSPNKTSSDIVPFAPGGSDMRKGFPLWFSGEGGA